MAYKSAALWILGLVTIGAIVYIYYAGGSEDYPENYGIAFVAMIVGMVIGGMFI